MADSMIAAYIAEEYERETRENEHGFISFSARPPEFLIGDIYVRPESRGRGHGQVLALACESIAKERGCSYLSCNVYVDPSRPEFATNKVRKFIRFGFNILRLHGSDILMTKELKGE
jgi:predicted GNAT superfamily acetyltransferase